MKMTLQGTHKLFTSGLFIVCLFFAFVPGVFAYSMSGNITVTGGTIAFNKRSLMKASTITGWTIAKIGSDNGAFASLVPSGSVVTLATPWFFGGSTQPVFWTAAGLTFDLTSSTIDSRSKKSMTLSGAGTLSGNGFDATAGDWTLTYTKGKGKKVPSGFVFSFTAAPVGSPPPGPAVPDSGSTLALFGLAVSGLICLQLKRARLE